jgi:hypothetical protein
MSALEKSVRKNSMIGRRTLAVNAAENASPPSVQTTASQTMTAIHALVRRDRQPSGP